MAGVSENTIDQSTDVASTPPESTRLPEKEENIVGLEQTSDHASKENREYASIENGIRGDVEQQQQVTIVQDEAPFSIWNSSQKKMIILVASAAAFFSPVSGQIYFPALNIIAEDLNVTDTMVNLSITTYMIMQGLAPAFVGELSDNIGRRPAYLSCAIIYFAANIGLAVQNSYPALMILRCLQSAGSSGTVALANALVADLVTSSERGKYIAYTSVAPMVGPSLGPIIGGLLSKYAGWHFIFWFLAILAAVVFVPLGLLLPETCRKIVGDGSIPPPKLNWCITNTIMEKNAIQEGRPIPWEKRDELAKNHRIQFPNPLVVFKLLLQKECGPALLYSSIVCCGLYSTVALIPSQFGSIYNFNELQISLCYLPMGVGSMIAAFIRGRAIDARFQHHAKRLGLTTEKNRKFDLTNFPIEKARIEVALPTIVLACAGIIGFGWTVQYKANLAWPLILLFIIGFCVSSSLNSISVLMVDIYPAKAGSVTAANNVLRCWLGAGATALVIPMINAMGIGWTCTFFGLVIVAFSPVLWYIMNKGPGWRRETARKKDMKEQANKVKNENTT